MRNSRYGREVEFESFEDEDVEDLDEGYDDFDAELEEAYNQGYEDGLAAELDEGVKTMRVHRMKSGERADARRRYKANKGKILRAQRKLRKTAKWQRHQAKLDRLPAARPHMRRMVTSNERDGSVSEAMDYARYLLSEE